MNQHRTHTNTKDKENLVKCEENVHFPAKFGKFYKKAIKLRLCRMQKRAVCFLVFFGVFCRFNFNYFHCFTCSQFCSNITRNIPENIRNINKLPANSQIYLNFTWKSEIFRDFMKFVWIAWIIWIVEKHVYSSANNIYDTWQCRQSSFNIFAYFLKCLRQAISFV